MLIENNIVNALGNNELYVVYQPKVNIVTGKIVGAEALVRWHCTIPELTKTGILSPKEFIPITEKNGFAQKIDFFVYEKTFEFIRRQLDENKEVVPISLNMSRTHTNIDEFITDFTNLLQKYEVPPKYVELEIVERSGEDDNMLKNITDAIHNAGFIVNMDDFGSGESSLNMLNEIPVDIIKIDQRFLAQAGNSEESLIILQSMINMIHKLNKKMVCEGVETEEQGKILSEAGCKIFQGFLFSKPLSEEDFIKYMQEHI